MNIIKIGTQIDIANNFVEVFPKIPNGVYKVIFDKMSGFHLELLQYDVMDDIKIYGDNERKISKVLKSYQKTNKNLGVILSGERGMGKTLFVKQIIKKTLNDYPIILVQECFDGLAEYLSTIKQEVIIIFDEFDKIFNDDSEWGDGDDYESGRSQQTQLLTLFDGIYIGKKLFIITCNNIFGLNRYFINRPGRFHYHFRFTYPTIEEIKVYLKENVNAEYHNEINNALLFSKKINLTYDMLDAISFELNNGEKFADFINDLNIINIEITKYDIYVKMKDGDVFVRNDLPLNLFSNGRKELGFQDDGIYMRFSFTKDDLIINDNNIEVNLKNVKSEDDSFEEIRDNIDSIIIKRCKENTYCF